ncbi:MAG: hypothetical protein COZ18_02340 [Flexibacter sp. CG_4_10_14_3_um_filter_32_15]|nr:MAG: hypothetical protein COZ18_02340 [Flexibacter sp. CG_4_10_14_3_um_filter_32_15]
MLPSIQEYIDSFRETTDYFKTLKLQSVPSKFDANEPYFVAGGFACVFKVKQNNEFWAFKCFLQEDKHRNERLTILSKFLQERTESYFIKTHFYTDELWVCSQLAGDAEYPTFAMPWIEGQTLGEYIHQAAKGRKTEKIKVIYDEFLRLAHFLLTNEFAHGDLKHDNILVTQDQNLILIDYDGMYLPQLAHISSQELGGHAYQHPKRTAQDWGKHIDDFSILVILLSLRAFIVLPSLIDDHHTENLLLTDNDIKNPMQSPLLQTLWQQEDEQLKHLLSMLLNSVTQNNLRVLEIGVFLEMEIDLKIEEELEKINDKQIEVLTRMNVNDNYLFKSSHSSINKERIAILKKKYMRKPLNQKRKINFDKMWWNGLHTMAHYRFKDKIKGNENELDFFDKIRNLTTLNASDFGTLPSWLYWIEELKELTELNLEENRLEELPKGIWDLTKITILNLADNELTSLSKDIGNSINLTELIISNNRLILLPESIGNLINLSLLNLKSNRITQLPESIGNLTNLIELNLMDNQLTTLPKSIGRLKNLTRLDLSYNKIALLSENIGNLTKLTNLDLQNNKLNSIPKSIGNLTNLDELNLRSNKITLLPNSIEKLTNLSQLDIGDTDIPFYEKRNIQKLLPNCEVKLF